MAVTAPEGSNLLPPYRVLDLTGPEGVFCGKFLADYGADVVKIEPPTGDLGRFKPPFVGYRQGIEGSGYFLFYNHHMEDKIYIKKDVILPYIW